MNASFDPYLKWLGIRHPERPPNYYRLLGIDVFESDPDVIATSADRQMAHVRRYQSGSHAQASQDLLNELAAAKLLLLSPEKKAAFDRTLRQAAPQEPENDVRVVRWSIITFAALGILALSVVIAKWDSGSGELAVEMADAVGQAEIAVTDVRTMDENDAADQEEVGGDLEEVDVGDQTYDHGANPPILPAIPDPVSSQEDRRRDEGEHAGTSASAGQQAPLQSNDLSPPWETETVDRRPIEIHQTGTILDDIRNAMAEGDLVQARLDLAEAVRDFPDDVRLLDGLTRTTIALEQFQRAVRRALNGDVTPGTLLDYGSSTIAVESVDETQIVLAANGDRKPFSDPSKLPPLLSEALAKHVLQNSGNQQADLVLGAFWAFSQQGNRDRAQVCFDRARHLGADVDLMLESWHAPGARIADVRATDPADRFEVPAEKDFNRAWNQVKKELSLPTRIKSERQKFDAATSLITRVDGERDVVKRYVRLMQAVHYATLSGNTALALNALDEIVSKYDVDTLKIRLTWLEKLKSTTDRQGAAQVAQAALQAMEFSIDQDEYSIARRFLAIATSTSKKSNDPKLVNRTDELRLRLRERSSANKKRS